MKDTNDKVIEGLLLSSVFNTFHNFYPLVPMRRKGKLRISIDPEVVKEIDRVREIAKRSTWIEDRLKKALEKESGEVAN